MLLVALNGVGEVSQRRVDGAHVAQLPGLRQPAPGLARQQHTLFMAGQSVGVVADGRVHVTQTAEGGRRSLKNTDTPTQVRTQNRATTQTRIQTSLMIIITTFLILKSEGQIRNMLLLLLLFN